MMKKVIATTCLALFCAAGGCTKYYKVTDPTTGREYYTTQLTQKGSGAATIKDGRTGNIVNLQNSEIQEVSKEQYETGRTAPVMPAPRPQATATEAPQPAPADKATASPFK